MHFLFDVITVLHDIIISVLQLNAYTLVVDRYIENIDVDLLNCINIDQVDIEIFDILCGISIENSALIMSLITHLLEYIKYRYCDIRQHNIDIMSKFKKSTSIYHCHRLNTCMGVLLHILAAEITKLPFWKPNLN